MGCGTSASAPPPDVASSGCASDEKLCAQLEAAAKDALGTAVRTGNVDRQMLVEALASNTALTARDAEQIAVAIESRLKTVRARATEVAERAKTAALEAAEATGKALMGLSIALLLGLGAAIGGSLLTGQDDRRRRGPEVTTAEYRT